MLLELTLYLLIGFVCLIVSQATTLREILKNLLFIVFWPYFVLLKYVEYVDKVKQSSKKR